MILSIGNRVRRPGGSSAAGAGGFTFFEVMAATVILAGGMVMIYKSLLSSLTVQEHLQNRLRALEILESEAGRIEQRYYENPEVIFEPKRQTVEASVGLRPLTLQFVVTVDRDLLTEGVERLDLELSWKESVRDYSLQRSLLFYYPPKEETGEGAGS